MSTIFERAKEDVDDETVFSRDQINCLWDMLYALKPLLDVPGPNNYHGNWPWQRGHGGKDCGVSA